MLTIDIFIWYDYRESTFHHNRIGLVESLLYNEAPLWLIWQAIRWEIHWPSLDILPSSWRYFMIEIWFVLIISLIITVCGSSVLTELVHSDCRVSLRKNSQSKLVKPLLEWQDRIRQNKYFLPLPLLKSSFWIHTLFDIGLL